jgi:hypothetical protein
MEELVKGGSERKKRRSWNEVAGRRKREDNINIDRERWKRKIWMFWDLMGFLLTILNRGGSDALERETEFFLNYAYELVSSLIRAILARCRFSLDIPAKWYSLSS